MYIKKIGIPPMGNINIIKYYIIYIVIRTYLKFQKSPFDRFSQR